MNDKTYWLQCPEKWFAIRNALLNPVRFFLTCRDKKVTALLQEFQWDSLCDIGCGSGDYLSPFVNKQHLFGVDYSEKMLYLAKDNKLKNFHLCCGNALQVPIKDKAIDIVVAIGLIDYLNNIDPFLAECSRIAKRYVIFTAPHTYSPFFFLRIPPFLFLRRYLLGIPKIDNSYTKKELTLLLNKHNIKPKDIFIFFGTLWFVVGVKDDP